MSFELFLVIILAVNLVFAAICTLLASRWGRDPFGWMLVGAVLGPIGLIVLVADKLRGDARPRPTVTGSGASAQRTNSSVLVAVDGSEMSQQAVQYVVDHFGASVGEVTVVGVLPLERAEGVQQEEGMPRKDLLEEEIERYLGAACSTLHDARIGCKTVVRFGEPGKEIVDFAREMNASLIVMGRRGRGRATKLLLGSVSDKVTNEAHCPVTVIG